MSSGRNETDVSAVSITRRIDGEVVASFEHKIKRHSPTGFNVGYGGSGPADTALNLLLHVLDEEPAVIVYQQFKNDVIAVLKIEPGETIVIPEVSILEWSDGFYSANPELIVPKKVVEYRETKNRMSGLRAELDDVEKEAFGDKGGQPL